MRLNSMNKPAWACTIALMIATGLTAAAQSSMAGTQMGSTVGGSSGAGSSSAAAMQRSGNGVTAVPEDFSKLLIQPGFLLSVQVFDEPDMSGQFRVGPAGDVLLPLMGPVHVAGDTLSQAQSAIETTLKTGEILKHPQVTLDVAEYAPTLVTVLGEVTQPGRLQMLAPHTLLDVVALAGGETQLAGGVIKLRHEETGKTVITSYAYGRNSDGNAIANVMVHDGDTVIVPRAGIVYVLGQVTRPGGFLMQEDGKLNAAQAISMAWGTTLLASTKHVLIIRPKPDGTFVRFELNYKDMVKGKVAPPQLKAEDIIYVPNSKLKTALTDLQTVLAAASQAAIYRTVE
ncbi:MAG TPA: polysaccharide biosynthesis/export family protein [Terracidiphilus sp.]|jgi:polysaccharide export outer membrane protein|nr:polysaccharide biosynthesis/export family protein [Terracidiphilus sp.]